MKPIPVWKYAALGLFGFFFGGVAAVVVLTLIGVTDSRITIIPQLVCGFFGARWLIKREQRLNAPIGS